MKNKAFAGLAIAAVLIIGLIVIMKPFAKKPDAKKTEAVSKAPGLAPKAVVKKAFSKDMGGLTVKIMNSKGREVALKAKAFKSADPKRSEYVASLTSGRMQELAPGSYDLEIETVPAMLYKGVNVSRDKETVENVGCKTGSLSVKVLNSKKKDANYAVKILYPNSNNAVVSTATNRPSEVLGGVYDVTIATFPPQVRKGVRVESGKDTVLDLGSTGVLNIKSVDSDNREQKRITVRIKKIESAEPPIQPSVSGPIELVEGVYDIEPVAAPAQSKKGVKITAAEEAYVEFVVPAPVTPAKIAPAVKTKK